MKVSLSYELEFERVPEEIEHFMNRVHRDLQTMSGHVSSANYNVGSGIGFLSAIAALHDQAEEIKSQLAVIASIVTEYEKAALQLQADETLHSEDSFSTAEEVVGNEQG